MFMHHASSTDSSSSSIFHPVQSTDTETSAGTFDSYPPTKQPITLKGSDSTASTYLIETSISNEEDETTEGSASEGSFTTVGSEISEESGRSGRSDTSDKLWKRAAKAIRSRLQPTLLHKSAQTSHRPSQSPSTPASSKYTITEFDVKNCINVIKDIAIDLQQVRNGKGGKIDDSDLLNMRPVAESTFLNLVSSVAFFPRQVADFLDLDRCLKMMRKYLEGEGDGDKEEERVRLLPKILSVVLQCILLNSSVIEVADTYTVSANTPLGANVVNSMRENNKESFGTADSFDSASSIFTNDTTEADTNKAINRSFRRSTFASILRESFKIIESCTSSSLIHEPLTTSGHLTNVVKILLCYVNGGKTKYFIGSTEPNELIMIPVPKFIMNGEFEHHFKKSDYKYVMLTALKSLQNIISPPPILPSSPHINATTKKLFSNWGIRSGNSGAGGVGGGGGGGYNNNNNNNNNNNTGAQQRSPTDDINFIHSLNSFNWINAGLPGKLRRDIIDSMLNIVKYRKYETFALETSVDIMSRLISYNIANVSKNETIALILRDAFNTFVEAGRYNTKLAISMNDDSFISAMFQRDERSLNSSDTVINTLKTARKILLHSSSRGAKVHCLRIMNAFIAHFSSEFNLSPASSAFERYEATIRDIIVTKFFTKPILATMVDSYKVIEAFKHDTEGKFQNDKQLLLLNNSRKLMCLTTQYCSILSLTPSGRKILYACEKDASTELADDSNTAIDEFDETVVNYLDADDLKDAEMTEEEGDKKHTGGEEEEGGNPPTLFNGIIRWGFVDLLPSYQIEKSKSAASSAALQQATKGTQGKGTQGNHFLKNNTRGLYKNKEDSKLATSTTSTLDLLWNNIDIYYDPPHPSMENYKDYNRTDDDCSTVMSSKGETGYMLGNVRPVNSIVSFNLTSILVNFCQDIKFLLLVLDSDALSGLVLRFVEDTDGSEKKYIKDEIYSMAEDNMKRSARLIHAHLKEKCEKLALNIVKTKMSKASKKGRKEGKKVKETKKKKKKEKKKEKVKGKGGEKRSKYNDDDTRAEL